MTETPIGWRIYYADGNLREGVTPEEWQASRSDGIQVVVVFLKETYKCWHSDPGEWRIENYCKLYHDVDYYWLKDDEPVGGTQEESRQSADSGTVKVGTAVADEAFWRIYNRARNDRRWR